MYRYFRYSVVIVFVWYWLSTILFNLPNCYIKIKTLSYNQRFQDFFGQKWNFFAPPPTFNSRLYFGFFNRTDSSLVVEVEVIESVLKAKKEKRPLNWNQEILDYTLASATMDLHEQLKEAVDVRKIIEKNEDENISYNKVCIESRQKWNKDGNFPTQVLHNYGRRIALEKKIDINSILMKVTISKIDIPKFVDRFKDSVGNEIKIFESGLVPIL
jgi:hypothetical protein